MSRFFSSAHSSLNAYVPGEQPKNCEYLKLNTNESPYPPSPSVFEVFDKFDTSSLRLYPDPECVDFTEALAEIYGLPKDRFIPANGSDEILQFAFNAFADPDNGVAFPDITYGLYTVCCSLYNFKQTLVPLDSDFRINPEDYRFNDRMIVFANPNAPTGISLSLDDVEKILKYNPDRVVLVDEAYVDFGGESAIKLIEKYDNLLVVMTFSKSRSLAGERVAFAVASPEIISDLEKIRYSFNPYNLSRISIAAGAASLRDREYFSECCKKIISTRAYTANELMSLDFEVLPSSANFIFAKHASLPGKALYEKLKERGVLVRHFSGERIKDYVRISIGTNEDMTRFISTVKAILSEANQ